MDVVSLLDDQWCSHKPLKAALRTTASGNWKPISQPVDLPPKVVHSLSDSCIPSPTLQTNPEEDAPKLQQFRSAPSEALPSVPEHVSDPLPPAEEKTDALSHPEEAAGDAVAEVAAEAAVDSPTSVEKRRYEDGLGPAPPLVTALILLLMPLWIPVLAFFLLPLAFTWAFIAGTSLVFTGFFTVLNRWCATAKHILGRLKVK